MDFPKHIVSAAGLVLNDKNEVLLVKDFRREPFAILEDILLLPGALAFD